MSNLIDGPAPHFFQVSYVVRDLEAAHQWLKRVMGVKHFGVTEVEMGPEMNFQMRGKPAHCRIKLSVGRLGPDGEQEIEVIQPISTDSIYQEFLDTKGPGIHHVACLVPDYQKEAKRFLDAGLKPIIEGTIGTGHFAYFDCNALWGSFVEIVQYGEDGGKFIEELKGPK